MSRSNIRAAIEKHLATLSGLPDLSWENSLYTPVIGTPYIRLKLAPVGNERAAIGPNAAFKENGLCFLNIYRPFNEGPQNGDTMVDNIIELFLAGTELTEAGQKITILKSESHEAVEMDPWYLIPVTINYYSYI